MRKFVSTFFMLLVIFTCISLPVHAQYNTKVKFSLTWNPLQLTNYIAPACTGSILNSCLDSTGKYIPPPVCSSTVTANCLAGFVMCRQVGASPSGGAAPCGGDVQVLVASPLLNPDGTINMTDLAQVTAVTADQPPGKQTYYVQTKALDNTGASLYSVPSVSTVAVVNPTPASKVISPLN